MMRAVVLPRFGGPDVFVCEEVARPVPRADQMLVKVAACGVCGHDLLNRAGHFPHTRLPAVMGHEVAGIVVETGALVTRFKAGDRVAMIQRMPCGLCASCRAGRENVCVSGPGFYGEQQSGGYGEYVLATERNATRVPQAIPLRVAAVLSCAIGTGYHALRRANLRLGDTVAITGASGGVGLHAVMLAKAMGLRAIAISTSQAKADALRAAGAADVVIAPDLSFHKEIRDLTGEGADAVIEIAGKPSFASSMRALRSGGRLVMVGNVDPGPVSLNPALSILKEIDIIGSAHATLEDLRAVIDLVERGLVTPQVADFVPVEEAGRAHAMMEDRSVSGRVVLVHRDAS